MISARLWWFVLTAPPSTMLWLQLAIDDKRLVMMGMLARLGAAAEAGAAVGNHQQVEG